MSWYWGITLVVSLLGNLLLWQMHSEGVDQHVADVKKLRCDLDWWIEHSRLLAAKLLEREEVA